MNFGSSADQLANRHSSDDSDSSESDLISSQVKKIVDKAKNQRIKLGTAIKMSLYDKAGPMTLVELNERMNSENYIHNAIQKASRLLSLEPGFYNVK